MKDKYCSSRDYCVAFSKDNEECRTDNGCFTEENVEAYLEGYRRFMKRLDGEQR